MGGLKRTCFGGRVGDMKEHFYILVDDSFNGELRCTRWKAPQSASDYLAGGFNAMITLIVKVLDCHVP